MKCQKRNYFRNGGDVLLLDDGSCVNVCGVNVNQDTVIIDFT